MASPIVEQVVQPPVNAQHLAYCPAMDLIALATIDERVHVYRLNGNEVFGVVDRHPPRKVCKIRWKANGIVIDIHLNLSRWATNSCKGHSLAVAFDSHSLCLTDSHTGKVLHHIDSSKYTNAAVCCLGWGIFVPDASLLNKRVPYLDLNSGDINSKAHRDIASNFSCDLPNHLSFLDVEHVLPKLSPLSTASIE